MYAKKTKYKIANTSKEYENCKEILKGKSEIGFPTVIAKRKKKIIGLITTRKGRKHYFAISMNANSIFTCIRLYKFYDDVMKDLGIDYYLFNIKKNNKKMINTVEKLFNIKPYNQIEDLLLYVRRLNNG